MDMLTMFLLMSMMGGNRSNSMLPLILMMMMGGGGSGGGMSLSTTAGTLPINFSNAMMWGMMPRMGTLPAMLTGGLDAVIGQSMFKPKPRRRVRARARYYRPRRRRYY